MEEQNVHLGFRLLDNNIKRSNKLGDFILNDIIDLEYWEVRYTLPELMMNGLDELISYFEKKYNLKNVTLAEKVSFYFFVKDELVRISQMEMQALTPMVTQKSNVIPSPRSKEHPALMELHMLSDGCPLKAKKIKKLKYSEVFDILLAITIKSEEKYVIKEK